MIQSYIDTPTVLTSNADTVKLQTDCIRTNSCSCNNTRSWLCHSQGSANYEITQGGLYELEFNATVSSSAAGGVVALQLYNSGETIPGTLMAETLAAAGDVANVGINKKIRVCCNGSTTISIRSVPFIPTPTGTTTGTSVTTIAPIIDSANFSIRKIA